MQMDFSYRETWLHKINPSLKLLVVVILFIHILSINNINFIITYTVGALVLYMCCTGHSSKNLFLISIPFLFIFLTSSTSMIFFGKGDVTWFKWGLIDITEESFFRGLHLGFRGILFAILGIVFSLTTRPVLLFYSLMQQVKLKPKFAYSFMAAVRLIPIIVEEMQTLRYALKVRGVEGQKGILGFYNKLTAYSIPLLSQSIRRAHRIAVAMEAKRFSDSTYRTYYYKIGFSKFDVLFVLYFILVIVVSYFTSIYLPYFSIQDVRYFN
ncbi:energy-coupling factor transporter transmembrane protein EcfT [Aquibacillus sp. 3ASR75-11]|uniref:Energy-coupling factor transporter transmembrane protein EcfT n=1 Tax=Terrihalobacillus insolitus TaxID=2950438 RepID=A0A9X3WSL1_9BACI|nr:energy-coupling factor transporter transmembrane component T [Terrihalobacillus insolitus]MDC3413493.1 energy-coupling factor transporter transmembrane protein EcfT [Terrihalobacillus insolitus]MDC3425217.1 energy-coupling factor transporter transmembrane protein EcfT [Terrihalobacillus insolitus]